MGRIARTAARASSRDRVLGAQAPWVRSDRRGCDSSRGGASIADAALRRGRCMLIAAAALRLAGCGSRRAGGGARTLNWYVFNEPGGAFEQAIDTCNKQANGRYKIKYVRLPTDADQQRELVVRRLAAEDSDIDIIGMDVIWTAEFAEAELDQAVDGRDARAGAPRASSPGPLRDGAVPGPALGDPVHQQHAAALVPQGPVKHRRRKTWDEMIDQAEQAGKAIEVQGAPLRGLHGLVQLADRLRRRRDRRRGGQRQGRRSRQAGRRDHQAARHLEGRAARHVATTRRTRRGSASSPGRSAFQVNYPFIYAERRRGASEGLPEEDRLGALAAASSTASRAASRSAGSTSASAPTRRTPTSRSRRRSCLAQPENQIVAAEKGGLPPTERGALRRPEASRRRYPFADLLARVDRRRACRGRSPRPTATSRWRSRRRFHPPEDIEPDESSEDLKDKLDKAAEGKIF